jgi:hypothetical protein
MRKLDTDSELSAEIALVRREFIHLSTADVETVARGRLLLKFDDMKGLTKVTDEEGFSSWYSSLSAEERAWYRRQVDLAEDRMAAQERANRLQTTPRRDVTSAPRQTLSQVERDGYGSGRQKRDSLKKIAADFGVAAVAKHIVDNGPHGITESDLAELVAEHAAQKSIPVAKIWAEDAVLCRAAAICRHAAYAKQAQHDIEQARQRRH